MNLNAKQIVREYRLSKITKTDPSPDVKKIFDFLNERLGYMSYSETYINNIGYGHSKNDVVIFYDTKNKIISVDSKTHEEFQKLINDICYKNLEIQKLGFTSDILDYWFIHYNYMKFDLSDKYKQGHAIYDVEDDGIDYIISTKNNKIFQHY